MLKKIALTLILGLTLAGAAWADTKVLLEGCLISEPVDVQTTFASQTESGLGSMSESKERSLLLVPTVCPLDEKPRRIWVNGELILRDGNRSITHPIHLTLTEGKMETLQLEGVNKELYLLSVSARRVEASTAASR